MVTEVKLPQLGQTMEEGTIVNCIVKVGDEVKKGDCLFEVETDKATLEMESPFDGFVKQIMVSEGQTIPVGQLVMILGDKDEKVPQGLLDSLKKSTSATPTILTESATPPAEAVKSEVQPTKQAKRVKASPRARKLAQQFGVDLATVTGAGPGGKITEQDVKKAAEKPTKETTAASEVKLGAIIPLNRLQKITAQKMLQSKREIPCFYLTVKADVTDLVQLREKLNETSEVKISYNDFLICAAAIGLRKFSIMTGRLEGETIKLADSVNVGLAVSVPDGLIAPVVKDAGNKNVKQIATDTKALVEKAQNKKLLLTDLEGACITISNLGGFAIESFIPIVIPGQCSILGVGRITDTCVPDNGGFVLRQLMSLTLSVDHRIANGAYAAQFLDYIRKLLEDTSTFG